MHEEFRLQAYLEQAEHDITERKLTITCTEKVQMAMHTVWEILLQDGSSEMA
jgi:hypothetical protein